MKKLIFLMFMLVISKPVLANSDEQALNEIVKVFKTSINKKDKSKFMALFVEGSVSWIGVHTQTDYENELKWAKSEEGINLKKRIGDKFREPAKYRHSTPEIFIDSIIDNTSYPKEEISNVRIVSDGEVASIYFDYIFYDGDKKVNSGKEIWLLINSGNGWKINAVNYSISRN